MQRMQQRPESYATTSRIHSIGVHAIDDALDMAMDKLEAAFVPKLIGTGESQNA